MVLKPISLSQLVQWNLLVFGLAIVALVGSLYLQIAHSGRVVDPLSDLSSYMHSPSSEVRALVEVCVHNEQQLFLSLVGSRIPIREVTGAASLLSLLTGLNWWFSLLLHRRWKQTGQL